VLVVVLEFELELAWAMVSDAVLELVLVLALVSASVVVLELRLARAWAVVSDVVLGLALVPHKSEEVRHSSHILRL